MTFKTFSRHPSLQAWKREMILKVALISVALDSWKLSLFYEIAT